MKVNLAAAFLGLLLTLFLATPAGAERKGSLLDNDPDVIYVEEFTKKEVELLVVKPGTVYAIRIELFPCSNQFVAGHCIRLDIASSNFPHFDLNFNTGEAEGLSTHARIATNTVYVDQARPSHMVLPIMPAEAQR